MAPPPFKNHFMAAANAAEVALSIIGRSANHFNSYTNTQTAKPAGIAPLRFPPLDSLLPLTMLIMQICAIASVSTVVCPVFRYLFHLTPGKQSILTMKNYNFLA